MSPRPKEALALETIIETAAHIADQYGIQEVTLASLAKKLAIRPPSLYNHLDGLAGLRKELAIYGLNKLYSELATASSGLSGEKRIMALSKAYVQFARKHPGVYEATFLASATNAPDVQMSGGRIVDLAIEVLGDYQLEENSALHAVRGLRSILHGFASLEQKGGFQLTLDLDVSLELIVKTFLAGIDELKNNDKGNSQNNSNTNPASI